MSNALAIATVTATLSQVVQAAASAEVPGANVKPVRPDAFKDGTPPRGVSLFLYQVTPNAAMRNLDLGTRRPDSSVMQRPVAALDLHYLLTFFGDEMQLEPQRMLGSVVSALHARPVLTRDKIRSVIAAAIAGDPGHFLGRSDLADQIEVVRFTPHPLNLEELSRLWSVFFQVPYALSILYEASAVLIEAKETVQPALPVRARNVYAVPLEFPRIEEIRPQIVEFAPGARITLRGQNLLGQGATVRFGRLENAPDSPLTNTELGVALPAGLRAGVQTAQVVQFLDIGTPPARHKGFESNAAAFILQPVIQSVAFSKPAAGPTVTTTVAPEIGPRQQVMLLLNEQPPPAGPEPRAFSFTSTGRAAAATSISFLAGGVPPATYLVRLRVDGAESNLGATVVIT